ncbi:hypothetical protein BT69DRAFT_619973 [Atractiella rhizophila]|nr:hypothetical protein BT69DRAFT_619973 [Atractiella rhizophila]
MKFGKELKDHAIDEWRRKYVNYRLLKKLIGVARRDLELQEGTETATGSKIRVTDARRLEAGQQVGADEEENRPRPLRRRSTNASQRKPDSSSQISIPDRAALRMHELAGEASFLCSVNLRSYVAFQPFQSYPLDQIEE